jgi:carbonic anhydrase
MPNRLLLKNQAWAENKARPEANYFQKLAEGQQPRFFWIGCADSRLPVSEITQSDPGEIFTHRNIANLIPDDDTSALGSLQYAVEFLKVPYVVVCGHYGCGGVKAALSEESYGQLDHWLQHIRSVYDSHQAELDALAGEKEKADRLVELNVKAQIKHIAATNTYQQAWNSEEGPILLGWVFNMETGLLNQLLEVNEPSEVDLLEGSGPEPHNK